MHEMEMNNTKSRRNSDLRYYDQIEIQDVAWLWYPYIPYGKITIVQGDPGEGKTTLMLQIAAMMTSGRGIPEGETKTDPQNVIFQGAEDGLADTIKPRLIRAGADCSRIAYLQPSTEERLCLGDERFKIAIEECSARLLVIDPLQAFTNGTSELHTAGGMRRAFQSLAAIAEETNCAVVLIGHMNKNTGGKRIYRGLGSIDVAAAARSVLMVARDSCDAHARIIIPVKTSLAPEGSPYAFRLDPEQGFQWIGEVECEAEFPQGNDHYTGKKLELAKRQLEKLLICDMSSKDVMKKMCELGIGSRTVETAKKELGVTSYKSGNIWFWHLKRKMVKPDE